VFFIRPAAQLLLITPKTIDERSDRRPRGMNRKKPWILLLMLAAVLAITVAACGGDDDSSSEPAEAAAVPEPTPEPDAAATEEPDAAATVSCEASLAWMGPATGEVAFLGQEQLIWAQFAIDVFNEENGTSFTLVEGDTLLDPAEGATVATQLFADDSILGIVGPAGSQVVEAVAPIIDGEIAYISGSATATPLTSTTTSFFRTVGFDDVQGPTIANFIIDQLEAQKVFIVDDQETYSTGLADAATVTFEGATVEVVRESVSQDVVDFSALVSKITDDVDVVFLPWQVAANGQLFADQMAEQGKTAIVFGSDGLFTEDFTVEGAYVSSFAPDITGIEDAEIQALIERFETEERGDLGTFGPPTYAAADALATATYSVCTAGGELSRASVLDAVRNVSIEKSILGRPIVFNADGDVDGAAFFIFQTQGGEKVLVS
jgi:branched-chain amino acid transport system substrate-binding protein